MARRVPARYRDVDSRAYVWVSLHTDSESVAKLKAPQAWQDLVAGWEAKQAGASEDAVARFAAARDIAARKGFNYIPGSQVLDLQTTEFLLRARAISEDSMGEPDTVEAAAMLGTVPAPKVTVSHAMELYFSYSKGRTVGMKETQKKKWEAPIRQANRDFIAVRGDKPIDEITREDMRGFFDWWIEKMEVKGLNPSTVNKNIAHFGKVLKAVNKEEELKLELPLGKLWLEEGETITRPPFSGEWIKERLLAPGALNGLHPEARAIFLVMINTGARVS